MAKFGLLLILIVLLLVFVWICAAPFFKFIGRVALKFAEPFKNAFKEKD